MNNNKLFSFKKELLRASVYGVIAIAFANLIFFSIYNNNQIYITIILIILEIITLVFLYIDASNINKRKLLFIKNNSVLEHNIDKKVSKENIIDRLKYFGYSMYSINSSRVFINAEVIKNKKSIIIHAYYFFLVDIDKDGEAVLNNIRNEFNEIFDLYIDDNQKLFRKDDNDKEKIVKAKLYNHAVFIFYGDNIQSGIIEMSEYGYTKEKLLNSNAQIFTVSYLPSNNKLYFADAIENVVNMNKFPKNDFVYIIKDIFSL
ncbi:hypothetical protein BHAMNSH16_11840 [Brachyspira hampsonii]|uniref:Uncharacterized protein n=1 Tax=Brachyspira hampsonii TaxID=1287055 RepID=A0AAC9TUP1_9SPIR|nr:hypothetical protein [Brachyspira hampsonii]ASJ22291.1 hypothetical protein BHAMNSH16_11840 [Brachyspira hampsonii]MBW5381229.1 hypothetical protein [Brachyspira hampsonii]OEJ17643.1 hypothetical protein A9496_10415 [Brachyspira hampsonii]